MKSKKVAVAFFFLRAPFARAKARNYHLATIQPVEEFSWVGRQ
jgi:hypothetical protein